MGASAPSQLRTDLATGSGSLLSVEAVTIRYRTHLATVTATETVSFEVTEGERLILLGPSGCGKSTLLKCVGGFIPPAVGRICLDGKPITGPGPDRIMVFQEFDQLMPWKTVVENVAFPLLASRKVKTRREAEDRAMIYVAKVGLSQFARSYPHTLSGGMKQRVAIARGLAMEPKILLMDEPFAALDALTRRVMQDELLRLWEEFRFTLMFVTHSIEEAVRLGSRIILLSPHPGRVQAQFTPADHPVGRDLETRIEKVLFGDSFANGDGI